MYAGLPLHHHPSLRESCADVLNEEWRRSATARLHMLDKSNDGLPYNIVYVRGHDPGDGEVVGHDAGEVVGHSRLCQVHGIDHACFVESVVIKKSLRGRGLGRLLMEETELHAKRLGFTTLYLTTHDKQDFYRHVGYEFCEPIISLGSASSLLSKNMINNLFGKDTTSNCNKDLSSSKEQQKSSSKESQQCNDTSASETSSSSAGSTPSAPPAPCITPPAPCIAQPAPSLAPPAPCIAPPAAPLAPSISPVQSSSRDMTPVRIDPSKVYWMRKSLVS